MTPISPEQFFRLCTGIRIVKHFETDRLLIFIHNIISLSSQVRPSELQRSWPDQCELVYRIVYRLLTPTEIAFRHCCYLLVWSADDDEVTQTRGAFDPVHTWKPILTCVSPNDLAGVSCQYFWKDLGAGFHLLVGKNNKQKTDLALLLFLWQLGDFSKVPIPELPQYFAPHTL